MAARFWVGGTGNLDGVSTTHISLTTGGGAGAAYPTSADTLTFDGASGGGTVTVTADVNFQSITMGLFTGTLDFSANNNNVTLSATTSFSGTGTGTRTLNMGNGTWSLTGVSANWDMTTTTGLTFNANGSTLAWTATAAGAARTFITGGLTYNNVTIAGSSPSKGWTFQFTGTATIAGTLTLNGVNNLILPNGVTTTVGNLVVNGTAAAPVGIVSATASAATVAITTATINWAALRWLTFTGGPSASNSFDLGSNTGVTITAPSGGGGGTGYSAARAYLGAN